MIRVVLALLLIAGPAYAQQDNANMPFPDGEVCVPTSSYPAGTGSSGQVVRSAGTSQPTWSTLTVQDTCVAGYPLVCTSTNVEGDAAGEVFLPEGFEVSGDYDTIESAPVVRYDVDGVQATHKITDAAPSNLNALATSAYPAAVTNKTGADYVIRAGSGSFRAAMTAASWVNNTTTFTVTVDRVANTNTEGSNSMECNTVTDTVCANNVANYFDGIAGIHACSTGSTIPCSSYGFTGTAGTVYFFPAPIDSPGKQIGSIACSTGAAATLTNGTDGVVRYANRFTSISDTGNDDGFLDLGDNSLALYDAGGLALYSSDGTTLSVGSSGFSTVCVGGSSQYCLSGGSTWSNSAGAFAVSDDLTATTVAIGGGTTILKHLSGTGALDYDLSAAGITCQDLTITVTGAAVADTCTYGLPAAGQAAGIQASCWVSSTNNCAIRLCDVTSSNPNPASATYRCDVWQH